MAESGRKAAMVIEKPSNVLGLVGYEALRTMNADEERCVEAWEVLQWSRDSPLASKGRSSRQAMRVMKTGLHLLIVPGRRSHGPAIGETVHLTLEFLRILHSNNAVGPGRWT